MFAHPAHYRRILVENQQNYTKKHPISDALSVALGRGLVTSDGSHWLKNRRILQPAFHKGQSRSSAQSLSDMPNHDRSLEYRAV